MKKTKNTFKNMDSSFKVVVFGGSGYLGNALIERLISSGFTNILSVSRNEGQLVALKEKFPTIHIMAGDIADPWVVKKAMAGAFAVYLLSALKHVGIAETNVNSCVMTNIVGTMNVVNESFVVKPNLLMFISSDKAAQGTGVYGCSKKIGEKLFSEAEQVNQETMYRVIRYGNVWGSTGSIAVKWKDKMQRGEEVILTDPEASRFFWTVDEAVDLIFECIEKAEDSSPYIPKMKAVQMGTVLEACMDVWGKVPVKVIGLQPGENKVETTDGVTFSDQVEQFTKEEFKEKFLTDKTTFGYKPRGDEFTEGEEKLFLQKGTLEWEDSTKKKVVFKPKISCILITKKSVYPEIILERLTCTDFFDEIIIVNESSAVYNRYLAAKKAKNELIFVMDDDCMVNYQELFKHYNGQITNAIPKDFQKKYEGLGCTLVGWGAYFPKTMLGVFDKYIERYGVDNHLLREADRIFTFLNQPFNQVDLRHEDLFQDDTRMGYQPDHYKSMHEALEKCKALI